LRSANARWSFRLTIVWYTGRHLLSSMTGLG
jgi:hypothetical protein